MRPSRSWTKSRLPSVTHCAPELRSLSWRSRTWDKSPGPLEPIVEVLWQKITRRVSSRVKLCRPPTPPPFSARNRPALAPMNMSPLLTVCNVTISLLNDGVYKVWHRSRWPPGARRGATGPVTGGERPEPGLWSVSRRRVSTQVTSDGCCVGPPIRANWIAGNPLN